MNAPENGAAPPEEAEVSDRPLDEVPPPDPITRRAGPGGPDADEVLEGPLEELRLIWVQATGDSVSRDLARARSIAEGVSPEERVRAAEFVVALERLSRWLRDF